MCNGLKCKQQPCGCGDCAYVYVDIVYLPTPIQKVANNAPKKLISLNTQT
jgi:hypothetical protein